MVSPFSRVFRTGVPAAADSFPTQIETPSARNADSIRSGRNRFRVIVRFVTDGPINPIQGWPGVGLSSLLLSQSQSEFNAKLRRELAAQFGVPIENAFLSLGKAAPGKVAGDTGGSGHAISFDINQVDLPTSWSDEVYRIVKTKAARAFSAAAKPLFSSGDDLVVALRERRRVGLFSPSSSPVEYTTLSSGTTTGTTPTTTTGTTPTTTTGTTPFAGKPESRLSQEEIKRYQRILVAAGHSVGSAGADGDIGRNTRSAIRAYQQANRLTVSGSLDERTQESLEAFARGRTIPDVPATGGGTPAARDTGGSVGGGTPAGGAATGSAVMALRAEGISPQTIAALGVGVVVVGLAVAYSTGALSGPMRRVR